MKQLYMQVKQDFEQGNISWNSISMSHIQSIGSSIIEKVMNEADELYESIRT